jgi:hypothetical protein
MRGLLKKIWYSSWFRVLIILPLPLWLIPVVVIYDIPYEVIIILYFSVFWLACKFNNPVD